jgi:glyoxylate reductase
MKPRVLITNAVPDDVLEPLSGLAEVILGPTGGDIMPRSEVMALGPTLTGILNQGELRVDAEFLDACPDLKIVANVAVGFDNFDPDLMAERGVWATNCPGIFEESAADAAVGSLLCMLRRIHEGDQYVRSGEWKGFQPGVWDGVLLRGRRVGIVGYGSLGRAFAARLAPFGPILTHHCRTPTGEEGYRSLDDLLAESDIVVLMVPLNTTTHHLLNHDRLSRMKNGAYLVNFARGKVIDESALIEHLQSGHLAGAALDVFEDEPFVPEALRTLPNTVLTPHLGGGTTESRFAARRLCAENIALVLEGKPPKTPVNRIG